jgi:coenzyme F420-0:L-glutamate ligase/coenzyme F420-1:gamma-L-glutamate ligase
LAQTIQVIGIEGIPDVQPGDDLAGLLIEAASALGLTIQPGDVLVIAQKIVSKSEGRLVDLNQVQPSPFARTMAEHSDKDARLVEVILGEARRIVKMDRGVVIVETHHGFVCANGGVDRSNVGSEKAALLPVDPDASAWRIRERIGSVTGADVAIIISDTFGRPWREGLVEVAIGVSGLNPLRDYRGERDQFGYEMQATVIALADELASAAGLVFGKTDRVPAAIVRGVNYERDEGSARLLVRNREKDLFR